MQTRNRRSEHVISGDLDEIQSYWSIDGEAQSDERSGCRYWQGALFAVPLLFPAHLAASLSMLFRLPHVSNQENPAVLGAGMQPELLMDLTLTFGFCGGETGP